ncbi:hypothetical protein [Bradyrhizobium sp. ORS 375]|uniref:hypothetical protein n=1 Tax=Bradyrhizobium sp. (strain ORS 375) TaxID=566679 RepID=UPI001111AEF3|nr:hypothetical protein [Bradyrhizobium sp. ORS 375]
MPSVDRAETIAARALVDSDKTGSGAAFSAGAERLFSLRAPRSREANADHGSGVMTPAGRLSTMVAYAAFAFVGAIVIGLI